MLTAKYKPNSLNEYLDHKESVQIFLNWIKKWKRGKALLFHGIPGIGKTALVEAYAKEKNLEFIEMNASDFRSASQIKEVLGQSMKQSPLFKKGKIFLIDEIDGLVGREDFGGVGEIIKIVKESVYPIILTANNPWNHKIRSLRQHCQLVSFKKIPVWDIQKRLKFIAEKEKIKVDDQTLKKLAKISEGDLRSAINDLEAVSAGKKEVSIENLENLDSRERETNIFDAMKAVFKTKSALAAKLSLNYVDKDPEEIFWWLENNILNEYEDREEIAKAFDALSKADLFRKFISSTQNWRFRGYMIDMMSGGVATAKKEMYRKFTRYEYPSNIIILGRSKEDRKESKELMKEISLKLHCSSKKVKKEFLPYIKLMKKNKPMFNRIKDSLELTNEEIL